MLWQHRIAGIFLASSFIPLMAMGDEAPAKPAKLKVCQDPNNMPFSNLAGEGIENRIATLFGEKLGVPVEYFSFPQRLAFVRNTLRYKLPGEDYRCDVMLGVPDGFGQVATTNAYYRSTYALVYPKGGSLDGVSSGDEFLGRASKALAAGRLGIHDKSPAAAWLAKHQLTDLARTYPIMSPDPDYYPGHLIDEDLAQGKIDAAILWGPIAGYFAPRVKNPPLVVVPLTSEPGVRFDYAMAMGVRYGEPQWRGQIQRLIDESRAEIDTILLEYGVPLVNEMGESVAAARGALASPDKVVTERAAARTTTRAATATGASAQAPALIEEKQRQEQAARAAAERTRVAAEKAAAEKVAAEKFAAEQAVAEQASAQQAAPAPAPVQIAAAGATANAASALYQVRDGTLVDNDTYEGFKTWRAAACDRCHGANQEGLVGPSLITSLKTLTREEFVVTVRDGRLAKGMQSFGNSKVVMDNIDHLYAYLKGRSDGDITQAKVQKMPQ